MPLSQTYHTLRAYLDKVPVIDTHEHYFSGTDTGPVEAMAMVHTTFYTNDDLGTVSPEAAETFKNLPITPENQFGAYYEAFSKAYAKCRHTGYLKGNVRGLRECWGVDVIDKASMQALQRRMGERDNRFYGDMMEKYKIRAKIIDTCNPATIDRFAKTGKAEEYSSYCRFAFQLAAYHNFLYEGKAIPDMLAGFTGMPVQNLDAFAAALEHQVEQSVKAGVVCFKDQSAYRRIIRYDVVPKHEAEAVYKKLLAEGRLCREDAIRLSNWIMRYAMSLAGKYKLPVQVHTGHMAKRYNEITKTNAVHLTSLINDYPDVHFDLFHGNWPYMGEYLFLAKNYPNVSMDLCWAQAIDPEYCVELMRRAVMTVPHCKLLAFGGDCCMIESTIGFLCQARDNVARALSALVESGYLSMDDAMEIACDWFFNNPNEIFRLGFETCEWNRL